MKFIDQTQSILTKAATATLAVFLLFFSSWANALDTDRIEPRWCLLQPGEGDQLQGYVALKDLRIPETQPAIYFEDNYFATPRGPRLTIDRDEGQINRLDYVIADNTGTLFKDDEFEIPEGDFGEINWSLFNSAPTAAPISINSSTTLSETKYHRLNLANNFGTLTFNKPAGENEILIINRIAAGNGANLVFKGGTVYIGEITTGNNFTIQLGPGTYFVDKFSTGNSFSLSVDEGEEAIWHVGSTFAEVARGNINNHDINVDGDPSQFRIVLQSSPTVTAPTTITAKNNVSIHGLIYSTSENTRAAFESGAFFYGGIVIAGEAIIGSGSTLVITRDDFGLGGGGSTPPPGLCLDHVRITIPTNDVVSCTAAAVQVEACSNSECFPYANEFNYEMRSTPNTSLWRSAVNRNPAEFVMDASGQQDLFLANVPGGTATVLPPLFWNVAANDFVSPPEGIEDPVRCFRGGVREENCSVNFIESGLVITGPNANIVDGTWEAPASLSIPAHAAGSSFDTYLWAIRTDTNTGTCEAALSGEKLVGLGVRCEDPGACSPDISYLVNGTDIARASASYSGYAYSPVNVTFNEHGRAVLTNYYEDVGQFNMGAFIQLERTEEEPTDIDSAGPPPEFEDPDPTLVLQGGTLSSFVIHPYRLQVYGLEFVSGLPSIRDVTNSPFQAAGELFDVLIRGYSKTNQVTPNFGNESTAQSFTFSHQVQLPSGGHNGDLVTPTSIVGEPVAVVGATRVNELAWSEVGVLGLTSSFDSNIYLGKSVTDFSDAIVSEVGLFYPNSFSVGAGGFSNDQLCGVFTYMDHDALKLTFELQALSAIMPGESSPRLTENYTTGFPDLANIGIVAAETLSGGAVPDNLIARFEEFDADNNEWVVMDAIRSDWVDGVLQFSMPTNEYLRFARLASYAPDGPYRDVRMGLYVESSTYGETIDTAGAEFDVNVGGATVSAVRIGTVDDIQDIFYGRLALENVFGPEDEDLPVIMRAEYYNGSRFILNTLDSCTPYDYNLLSLVPDAPFPAKGGEVAGDLIDGWLPHSHMRWLALGSAGTVEFEYDAPLWLKYIWEQSATEPTNPTAIGEFGRYRSYDRILFRRQQ